MTRDTIPRPADGRSAGLGSPSARDASRAFAGREGSRARQPLARKPGNPSLASGSLRLLVGLWLCTGCFVFDEIDQGRKLMEKHSSRARAEAAAPVAAATPEERGPGLLARVQTFIEERRQAAAPERDPEDGIVRCEVEDGTTFTRESDCLSRGGRVL
jgi:hypothetical protein